MPSNRMRKTDDDEPYNVNRLLKANVPIGDCIGIVLNVTGLLAAGLLCTTDTVMARAFAAPVPRCYCTIIMTIGWCGWFDWSLVADVIVNV